MSILVVGKDGSTATLGDLFAEIDELKARARALEELLVTCRIRCERAEKRLALELRKRGELKP